MESAEYDIDNFSVTWGGESFSCNPHFFRAMNLVDTPQIRQDILFWHSERLKLFDKCKNLHPTKNAAELKDCAKDLEKIEFSLQKAWGLKLQKEWHSWWFRIPHCTCPIFDNEDCVGTIYRVYSENCPMHDEYYCAIVD